MRRNSPKKILARLAWYLGGLAVTYGVSVWFLSESYINPPRLAPGPMPAGLEKPVQIPGLEGSLPAFVKIPKGAKRVFVMVHGYGGKPGGWTRLAEQLLRASDTGVVIPAMRGQTVSPKPYVTFGPGEAREALQAAAWARKQAPEAKIIGVGVSLGASALVLASREDPKAFDALSLEAPFARLQWGVQDSLDAAMPWGSTIIGPVSAIASRRIGVDYKTVRPDLAAAALRGKPVLLIETENDELFGPRHRQAMESALGIRAWIIPGAAHAQGSVAATEEYARRLLQLAGKR